MDESMIGNVIGAGIGLAVIDRISRQPRRKRKGKKLKRVSEY